MFQTARGPGSTWRTWYCKYLNSILKFEARRRAMFRKCAAGSVQRTCDIQYKYGMQISASPALSRLSTNFTIPKIDFTPVIRIQSQASGRLRFFPTHSPPSFRFSSVSSTTFCRLLSESFPSHPAYALRHSEGLRRSRRSRGGPRSRSSCRGSRNAQSICQSLQHRSPAGPVSRSQRSRSFPSISTSHFSLLSISTSHSSLLLISTSHFSTPSCTNPKSSFPAFTFHPG